LDGIQIKRLGVGQEEINNKPLTRYIQSFASLAAGATQGLQTPHIAIRYG
jgi:hypothetical protein